MEIGFISPSYSLLSTTQATLFQWDSKTVKKHAAKAVGLTSAHDAQKEDYECAKLGSDIDDGSKSGVDSDGISIDLERDVEGWKKRQRMDNEDRVMVIRNRSYLF